MNTNLPVRIALPTGFIIHTSASSGQSRLIASLMAAFPPVDMQIQSADQISLIRAVLKNVSASLQLTPALQSDGVKEQRENDKKRWGGVEKHFIQSNITK